MTIAPKFRAALPQILAVSAKNVLLIGYGMTLGFPTIVIPAIHGGEGRIGGVVLTADQISWFSSINLICVPVGACVSGLVTQPIGRRRAMQVLNTPFLIAWILFHYANDVAQLYIGMALTGLAGGLLEAPVLTYVAEITQPHLRGILAASSSMCVIIGVFTQFLLGTFLDWRTVALVNTSFPILAILCLFFIPESPHWLISKNKLDEAKKSLQWLRGWVPQEDIKVEYDDLYAQLMKKRQEEHASCLKNAHNYTKRNFIFPFLLVTFLFFVGHFSGMTTLQTFAVQIFHTLKAPIDKYYATMILGLAQILGTVVCIVLIHYTGKRPLAFLSTSGCGVCFFAVATYAYFLDAVPGDSGTSIIANLTKIAAQMENSTALETQYNFTDVSLQNLTLNENEEDLMTTLRTMFEETTSLDEDYLYYSTDYTTELYTDTTEDSSNLTGFNETKAEAQIMRISENKYEWIPMTFLIASALLSHTGIRLLPWMLIGEVYPIETRGTASGISGGVGYVFGFLANKMFLNMISNLTLPGTFWFYSAVSLVGLVVLYFTLPETEGVTLNDIEMHFTGEKKLETKNVNCDLENSRTRTKINSSVIRKNNTSKPMATFDVKKTVQEGLYRKEEESKMAKDNLGYVLDSKL